MNYSCIPALFLLTLALPAAADSIVVFNEIMYHPPADEANTEWIELHNQNGVDVDLGGWTVTGDIQFTIPQGTRIRGRGYLVVSSNPATLAAAPTPVSSVGPFAGRLKNSSSKIELRDRYNRVMDSIKYGSDTPWPIAADGAGLSLSKINPNAGSEDPASWTVSQQAGGTPGQRNFPTGEFERADGLVSYWNFEDPGTVSLDLAGGNHGSWNGAGLSRSSGLVGTGAVAFASPGTASISIGRGVSNNLASSGGFTLEALVRPTWPGSGRATLFRKLGDNRGSLVSYWSFDEAEKGTNVVLDLVSGNHGLFRSTLQRTNGIVGRGALFFRNGNLEGLSVGTGVSNSFSFKTGFTVAAWVRPQWVGASNSYDAVFVKDDADSRISFAFQYDSSNSVGIVSIPPGPVLSLGLNIGGTYGELDMPLDGLAGRPTLDQLKDSSPHLIGGSFDSATGLIGIWVDGTLRYSATKQGTIKSGGNVAAFIGNRSGGGQPFSGTLDELGLWSSALTAADFAKLAAQTTPLDLFPLEGPGNRVQFGFRRQGDTDFTDPRVTDTPTLFFGAKIGTAYQELELLLDGVDGRPTLAELRDGSPHHLAAVYDPRSAQQSIAIDGVVRGSASLSGPLDVGGIGQAFLGNSGLSGSEMFQGTLDEVAVWSRALSPAELFAHASQNRKGRAFYEPVELRLPALAFNELPAVATRPYWIELINNGSAPVELEGILLSRTTGGLYPLAAQTLKPGEVLLLTQSQFGFSPKAGDLLMLSTPGNQSIIDTARVTTGPVARTDGGTGPWRVPTQSTKGGANQFQFHDEIVINELMYSAPPQYPVPAQFTNVTWIPIDATWKYQQEGKDLGTDWRNSLFDDSAWLSGLALFYNETSTLPAVKNTPLNLGPLTYYFRKKITITNDPSTVTLSLRAVVDDGAVVYLNGREVYRQNLRNGVVSYTNLTTTTVKDASFSAAVSLSGTNLILGENLVAVEVHQSATNSDDVVFGLELNAKFPFAPAQPYVPNPEQWIELYNRSSHDVNLAGWRFNNGVDYVFSGASSVIPAGGYLVVARDPNVLRLKYPALKMVGPWSGKLSGGGEELVLLDDLGNPADSLRFFNGGHWPEAPAAGGSSLELRDPFADNNRGEAWAASLEGGKSKWQRITYRGAGSQNGSPPDAYNELVIGLLDTGEVLIDDVTVKDLSVNATTSLIQNSDFEAGLQKWRVIGDHKGIWDTDPDDPTNHVMRIVATGMAEHMNNHAETTLKNGNTPVTLVDTHEYEISLRARWVSGSPQLNTRLFFNRLPRTTILPMPTSWGTPGARNSQAVQNWGPTYANLSHSPVVPAASQPVTISVIAQDPQGVAGCTLWWSTNGVLWTNSPMVLSGGLDRFAGVIPGNPAGRVVQFYVEGVDSLGAKTTMPLEGPQSRALFQVDDGKANLPLAHNVRIIMTPPDVSLLLTRTNLMSNDRIGCTVIYDEKEVVYQCGVRLKGSEHGRPNADRIGFNIDFPAEQLFRGVHSTIAIDRSGGWRFGTVFGQDEIIINHIVDHAGGVPAMHNDLIRVLGPQAQFNGSAILQMARYNPIFLDSQFDNGSVNPVFEYELYYGQSEQIPSGPEGLKVPQEGGVSGYSLGDQGDDKENYRLGYLIKNARDHDDYETLIQRLKIFSLADPAFNNAADQLLDVDEWLRAYALAQLCAAGDNFSGSGSQHNLQLYVRPSDGKLMHLLWDTDFAFTGGVSDSLENSDHLSKLLLRPANKHNYYGHIQEILETTYNTNYMAYWVDHYDNFTPGQNFSSILDFIRDRANYARGVVPKQIPFSVTNNAGQPFLSSQPTATIAGRGWVNVKDIRLLGSAFPLDYTWTGITNWTAKVPVMLGSNTFLFGAYHRDGTLLTNLSVTVVGTVPEGGVDSDGDGMPDVWEAIHDLNPNFPDAELDPDRDGFTNLQEYLAGTNPRSVASRLTILSAGQEAGELVLRFNPVAGRSYTVQYRDEATTGAWQSLSSVPASTSDQLISVRDPGIGSQAHRLYRLVTPAQ